ncbi:HAMP domain-containing sensor histidine kinase [Evansella sp. AB-P1]|uniref:HAMP domain-containing sensor histidine kinase n=1 Tax=Evansella sp. AB-P1 TaxID=3037653 RepID=UPI00241E1E0A|nr:HAMP domain-containing sensor histidine kinase [Evansella sp. AB-P1]MDG5789844.1 HAMP domain-containing sensor histidine kinase [Evansella sp. AB-P1]
MKIRTKIQLFSMIWLLAIILIINTAIYVSFSSLLMNKEKEQVEGQTENIALFISSTTESDTATARMLRPYLPTNGIIRIINEEMEAITMVTQRPELLDSPINYFTGQSSTILELENGEKMAASYFPFISYDGSILTLEVMHSLQPIQSTLNLLRLVLLIASILILLPALFGGAMLSRLILRPIKAMAETMQDIQQKGTLKKIDLKEKSKDELYEVAGTFNNMVDLIKENIEKKQQFVHDASHELKTPLTVIESNASMLKRWGAKNPEVLEESIDAIYSESKRMKELTEQMLKLAEESNTFNLEFQEVNLSEFIKHISSLMTKTYGRKIETILPSYDIVILGDEKKLQQVLVILIDNAFKYSKDNITIHAGKEGDNAYFSVKDKGIGIPKEDFQKIFDRFYRVDRVRSRKTGGTGLGLAIAKGIVEAHHGKINLDSKEGIGTTFTVKLPLIY